MDQTFVVHACKPSKFQAEGPLSQHASLKLQRARACWLILRGILRASVLTGMLSWSSLRPKTLRQPADAFWEFGYSILHRLLPVIRVWTWTGPEYLVQEQHVHALLELNSADQVKLEKASQSTVHATRGHKDAERIVYMANLLTRLFFSKYEAAIGETGKPHPCFMVGVDPETTRERSETAIWSAPTVWWRCRPKPSSS